MKFIRLTGAKTGKDVYILQEAIQAIDEYKSIGTHILLGDHFVEVRERAEEIFRKISE